MSSQGWNIVSNKKNNKNTKSNKPQKTDNNGNKPVLSLYNILN